MSRSFIHTHTRAAFSKAGLFSSETEHTALRSSSPRFTKAAGVKLNGDDDVDGKKCPRRGEQRASEKEKKVKRKEDGAIKRPWFGQ
jgi:hypothetical protein